MPSKNRTNAEKKLRERIAELEKLVREPKCKYCSRLDYCKELEKELNKANQGKTVAFKCGGCGGWNDTDNCEELLATIEKEVEKAIKTIKPASVGSLKAEGYIKALNDSLKIIKGGEVPSGIPVKRLAGLDSSNGTMPDSSIRQGLGTPKPESCEECGIEDECNREACPWGIPKEKRR